MKKCVSGRSHLNDGIVLSSTLITIHWIRTTETCNLQRCGIEVDKWEDLATGCPVWRRLSAERTTLYKHNFSRDAAKKTEREKEITTN